MQKSRLFIVHILIFLLVFSVFLFENASSRRHREECYGYDCDHYYACDDSDCNDNNPCTNNYCRDHNFHKNYPAPCLQSSISGCCLNDNECNYDEKCSSNRCEKLNCNSCQYPSNHQCLAHECCASKPCSGCRYCNNNRCKNHECCDDSDCVCGSCNNHNCVGYECCHDNDCGTHQKCNLNINRCYDLSCGYCQYARYHVCQTYDCCDNSECGSCQYCSNHLCENYQCCDDDMCIGNFKCINHKCSTTQCIDSYSFCGKKCYLSQTGRCCFDKWRLSGNCCKSSECSADEFCSDAFKCEKLDCNYCEKIDNHACVPDLTKEGEKCNVQGCPSPGCYGGTYKTFATTCDKLCNNGICEDCVCTAIETQITDEDGDGYDIECESDCRDDDFTVYPGARELCDGIDNNCNGDLDDVANAPLCSQQSGVCAGARKKCSGTLTGWDNCDNARLSEYVRENGHTYVIDEDNLCDKQDNDCDGYIDEGCPCNQGQKESCGLNQGECRVGERQCEDGFWSNCLNGFIGPVAELCDEKDNDCDGDTDEDFTSKLNKPCGQGICAGGHYQCSTIDNRFVECSTDPLKTIEVCNNLDDDCNGEIDNGIDPDECKFLCEKVNGTFSNIASQSSYEIAGCCGDDSGDTWCGVGDFFCQNGKAISDADTNEEICSCITGTEYDNKNKCCNSFSDNWCYTDRSAYCAFGNVTIDGDNSFEACECLSGRDLYFNSTDHNGTFQCCGDDKNDTWCSLDGLCYESQWYGNDTKEWCDICASDDGDVDAPSCLCKDGVWTNKSANSCCGDGPRSFSGEEDYLWFVGEKGCCIEGEFQPYCDTIWCNEYPGLCSWCNTVNSRGTFGCSVQWCKNNLGVCTYCSYGFSSYTDICYFCLDQGPLCTNCMKNAECDLAWCTRNSDLCAFLHNVDYSSYNWCIDDYIECDLLYVTINQCSQELIAFNKISNVTGLYGTVMFFKGLVSDLNSALLYQNIAYQQSNAFQQILSTSKTFSQDIESIYFASRAFDRLGLVDVKKSDTKIENVLYSAIKEMNLFCVDNKTLTVKNNLLVTLKDILVHKSQFSSLEITKKLLNEGGLEQLRSETIEAINNNDLNTTLENLWALSFVLNETYKNNLNLDNIGSLDSLLNKIQWAIDDMNLSQARVTLEEEKLPNGNLVIDGQVKAKWDLKDVDLAAKMFHFDNAWKTSLNDVVMDIEQENVKIEAHRVEVDVDGKKSNSTIFTLKISTRDAKNLTNLKLPFRLPPQIADMSEVDFDLPIYVIEEDPLIMWDIPEVNGADEVELKFVVDSVLCESGKECSADKICANMVDGVGLCKKKCKGCGTICDTGKRESEICSGRGQCVIEFSQNKQHICGCNEECESGYCTNNLCCNRGEFANSELLICTQGKTLMSIYSDNIVLSLGESQYYPLNLFNVYDDEIILETTVTGLMKEYSQVPQRIVLSKGIMSTAIIHFVGAQPGLSTLSLRVKNIEKNIDQTATFSVYTTTKAYPLGVEIKTASGLENYSFIILLLVSLFYIKKRS